MLFSLIPLARSVPIGVTIHYKGKLADLSQLDSLTKEIVDIATIMKWPCRTWGMDSAAAKSRRPNAKPPILRGVSFFPHPESEPVAFTVDKAGNLCDVRLLPFYDDDPTVFDDPGTSVKTQFAGVETHVAVINLLRYVKKRYIPDLHVYDEGEYWETGDRAIVARHMGFLNRAIGALADALREAPAMPADATPEDVAAQVERILKEKFGFGRVDEP